jgi:sterol desaturase/sphingolipid hydroxylase (fatty acid hydroxylase superfamily)
MPVWLVAFAIALFVGSLVEYWGHRLMHAWLLRKRHAEHHKLGTGQGWLWEFRDYVLGTCYIMPLGFVHSLAAGYGFLSGALFYGAFAAYSHQLQHEKPDLCFWLRRPVHYLHHSQHMWKNNFGISIDLWDRVFGTYRSVEWQPERRFRDYPPLSLIRIKWL